MANNPIGMVKAKRIIQLRSENASKLKISKQLKIHRKTLNEYLIKLDSTGKSYQELLNCSEAELMRIVYDPLNTRVPDPRFVDFAGKSLQIVDPNTGQITVCPVLVCVLSFSKYMYVEALPSAKQEHVFNALSRCMEYFGGVPRNILSDNMKQYIKKNEKYEFTFSEMVDQWAAHYNTNLEATRPGKPKDYGNKIIMETILVKQLINSLIP